MPFKIIEATQKDVEAILALADEYSEDSHQYKHLPYDRKWVRGNIEAALADEEHVILLLKHRITGAIVGGFWGYCAYQIFSPVKFGYDAFSFVSNFYRNDGLGEKLVSRFELWCKSNGVVVIKGGANSGIDGNRAAIRMYSKLGYLPNGQNLIKSII